MGVVFFPSLPFMGVMLFPSFWLGNAFGGGGASFASHSLVFSLSSSSSFLPLLPYFLFSLLSSSTAFSSASSSFFLPFSSVPIFFSSFLFSLSHSSFFFLLPSFLSSAHSVFLLCPLFFFFLFFERIACTKCFSGCS